MTQEYSLVSIRSPRSGNLFEMTDIFKRNGNLMATRLTPPAAMQISKISL